MPFIVLFLLSWTIMLIFVSKNRIVQLSKGAIIGVIVAVTADFSAELLNYYKYQKVVIPLVGSIGFFHMLIVFATGILYLNWLPPKWPKRFFYTLYISFICLVVETFMYRAGAILYIKWHLWESYPLTVVGLGITGYLFDIVKKLEFKLKI